MAEENNNLKVGILELDNGEKSFFMKDLYINLNLSKVEYRMACYPKFTNLVMLDMVNDKNFVLVVNYRKQIIGTITISKDGFTASDINTILKFLNKVNIPVVKK